MVSPTEMAPSQEPVSDEEVVTRVLAGETGMFEIFHFEKPSQFDFKPGQSADLTLSNPPETDGEGNARTFSIASPPFENGVRHAHARHSVQALTEENYLWVQR